jgi:hypothetical protein
LLRRKPGLLKGIALIGHERRFGKDVVVGTSSTMQQALKAGLLDEIISI